MLLPSRLLRGVSVNRTFPMLAAVCFAAASPDAASAATIVQIDDEVTQRGFEHFNSLEGILNNVTLRVDVFSKYRDWVLYVPSTTPTTREVSYVTNSSYGVFALFGGVNFSAVFPIFASGTQTVSLTPTDEFMAGGTFYSVLSGSASFSLNPAEWLAYPPNDFDDRTIITGNDLGYYDYSGSDTTFTINGSHSIFRRGTCGDYESGDDFCGNVRYTLTYDYTPFDGVGAVPEPGTWAMMLLGFGAIGFAMRRRRLRLSSCADELPLRG